MNRLPFFLVCVAAAAAGCAKDSTFSEPLLPHAGITWLNGVSDTGQLDIRVIDIPSNGDSAALRRWIPSFNTHTARSGDEHPIDRRTVALDPAREVEAAE